MLQIPTEIWFLQSVLFYHSYARRGGRGFHFPTPAVVEDLLHPVASSGGNSIKQQQAPPSARTLGSQVQACHEADGSCALSVLLSALI